MTVEEDELILIKLREIEKAALAEAKRLRKLKLPDAEQLEIAKRAKLSRQWLEQKMVCEKIAKREHGLRLSDLYEGE